MIFAKTIDKVKSRIKTQTLRLAYEGDYIGTAADGHVAVLRTDGRPRWIVGHIYAVQRERCAKAEAHFKCTSLHEVIDPLAIDQACAVRDGFATVAEFITVWNELHPSDPRQRCWAIGFVLCRQSKKSGAS